MSRHALRSRKHPRKSAKKLALHRVQSAKVVDSEMIRCIETESRDNYFLGADDEALNACSAARRRNSEKIE